MISTEDFWACELKSTKQEQTWSIEAENDVEHKLLLSQACLGPNAKENERHIVQVTCENEDGEPINACLVSLKVGLLEQCTLNIGFTSSATFKLVQGSGPIFLTGSHLIAINDDADLLKEDDEDEDVDDSVNISDNGVMSKKEKSGALTKKSKKQLESDSDDNKEEDDEDEGSQEEETDEDEEDDDESDEDDNEDEDEDDDNESEESSDIELVNGSAKNQKKGLLKNGIQKKKNADKKVTFAMDKAKVKGKPSAPGKTLDELKKSLSKVTNLPKTFEKFQNFISSNLKVTDPKIIQEAWVHVSKTRK